jgi:hypothetical protein
MDVRFMILFYSISFICGAVLFMQWMDVDGWMVICGCGMGSFSTDASSHFFFIPATSKVLLVGCWL